MKKIALSLVALGLLTSLPGLAATPAPVPAAIASHDGPIRIAVIRNLGSDDNTTQFVAGAIQEGKKLGFKVSTFLSNGDDARFQDFVNQAISQKYDGIILSQGRDPYSTALVKKAVDAGIKVSVFDTAVNGEIPGRNRYPAGRCLPDQPLFWSTGERFQRQGQYRQAVGRGLPADGAPSGGLQRTAKAVSGD